MQVKNVPIYKNGKVISVFNGDDATLADSAARLGGTTQNTGSASQPSTPAPVAPLAPLPDGGTPTDTTTPLPSGTKSPILSFADSLNAAVDLARKGRNAQQLDIMKPFQGTVAASDFGAILGNFNKASDKTASDLVKKVTDNTDLLTVSDAKELGVPYGTTKSAAAAMHIVPKNTTSDVLVHSGNLDYSRTDYSDDASVLEKSRGEDGWVDPTLYQTYYNTWVAHGEKIADFVKTFPPDQYVNPENDWLPVYLRPKKAGVVNPF